MAISRLLAPAVLFAIALLSACGTGNAGGGSNPPPTPDFRLNVNPETITLAAGNSESVNVSIVALNGFAGEVDISLDGLPSEVTASTTSFELSASGQQTVEFSASGMAAYTTATVTGVAGSNNHSAPILLTVALPATAAHAPIRTRYLRTDSDYDPNALQYAPPHFTVYDATDKRFFVSNPYLNRIDVFDATMEIAIAQIAIPGAWGIDISPDDTKLYAGTLVGDVYQIDPVQMQAVSRTPTASIGPDGFTATAAFVLANGSLALLGGPAGLESVDGYRNFAIWTPANNSLTVVNSLVAPPNGCSIHDIGAFGVNGDRTKVLAGSIDSDGTLCSYDVTSGQSTVGSFGDYLSQITATPDGKRFFVTSESGNVAVFDATTVKQLGAFQGPTLDGASQGIYGATLSLDGTTFYVVDEIGLVGYDTTSFARKGWVQSYLVTDLQTFIVPGAIDETGLIVGPIGHGVAFLDASTINSGPLPLIVQLGPVSPATGPALGDTAIQSVTDIEPGFGNLVLGQVYMGDALLENATEIITGSIPKEDTITGSTPASATHGPADLLSTYADGGASLVPEAFTYGPAIVEVVSNASTTDGGSAGAIVGYGFGSLASGVSVMVGGQAAQVTTLYPGAPLFPYPFPVETFIFTVPPGNSGPADITVTTASGSVTAAGAFHYAPALTSYPLPGSQLQGGIYDPHRNVYYFADASKIQVLSLTAGGWQTPITLPGVGANTRLLALSLSPDGSKLAVSDYGDETIFVLNPDIPGSAQSFNTTATGNPLGLAIINSGYVYYAAGSFYKLNTGNGTTVAVGYGYNSGSNLVRVLLSPDGSHVYFDMEGFTYSDTTSTDEVAFSSAVGLGGDVPELSMSADGTTLAANGYLLDASLNPFEIVAYTDRETWLPFAVVGQKLDEKGSVFFQPLTNGIDVINAQTGRLVNRVQLPLQLPSVYDSLVVDGADDVVALITADGVATIDLTSELPTAAVSIRTVNELASPSSTAQDTSPIARRPGNTLLANRPKLKQSEPPISK